MSREDQIIEDVTIPLFVWLDTLKFESIDFFFFLEIKIFLNTKLLGYLIEIATSLFLFSLELKMWRPH